MRGLSGDHDSVRIFSFKIKVGVYEKLAKSNGSSKTTFTHAVILAVVSIFKTALRLASAKRAGLACGVPRSRC